MRRRSKTRSSVARAALLLGLASLGIPRPARASSTYPPALKAALDALDPSVPHCVPACTACHLTAQGGPGMMNVFGLALETKGGLLPGNPSLVGPAVQKLAALVPPDDADGDGVPDFVEIARGDSPSIPLPGGVNQFCPDIQFGCGAHVASAPATDRFGLFSALLVVLGFAAARRRRAKQRADRTRC
jgi:hypothetical protein